MTDLDQLERFILVTEPSAHRKVMLDVVRQCRVAEGKVEKLAPALREMLRIDLAMAIGGVDERECESARKAAKKVLRGLK